MESLNLTPFLPYALIGIGIILILITTFSETPIKRLAQRGERCEGIIFELGYKTDTYSHHQGNRVRDKITVRFVTKKQEWITQDLNTDFMPTWTGQFKEGQAVQVLYNPDNPADFTLLNYQAPQLTKMIFIVAGILCLAVGICKFSGVL